MALKQILTIKKNSYLATISLEATNKLLLLIFSEDENPRSLKLINDKDTIIAVGSVPESLILFQNTEKIC